MCKRLKTLRECNNLSLTAVANLLEIKADLYLQYENGKKKIPLKHLSVFARKYNTSIDYIVGDTYVIKPHKKT